MIDTAYIRANASTASALRLLGVLGSLPTAADLEKPNLVLAVGGKTTLYYLPLTIAEHLGYFKDEGLNVEIQDFPGGAKALQALMGGSADVVSGAYEHTIVMQTLAQKLQAFVLAGDQPGDLVRRRRGQEPPATPGPRT